tara:strand:+ start:336 stop:554 length:219 start_codon:yes stop_codon:yes gene_type:complete
MWFIKGNRVPKLFWFKLDTELFNAVVAVLKGKSIQSLEDDKECVFVEVKSSHRMGEYLPEKWVDPRGQQRIF